MSGAAPVEILATLRLVPNLAIEQAEQRGAAEGARARANIRACVHERWARLHERVGGALVEQARATLERLAELSPELHAELRGCARACQLEPAELLVLDGGLVDTWLGSGAEPALGLGLERSIGFYTDGPQGPLLAGAWALPRAETELLELRSIADAGPLVLGLPGSFGLAGIGPSGLAIMTNLLRPAEPGVGVPGSALLRRALALPDVGSARALITSSVIVDGRNWMLGDGRGFFGIEQLGARHMVTRVSPRTGHVHTNHCFDPGLRQHEAQPRSPSSFRRMELASTLYVQQRPSTAEQVLEFLAEIEAASFPDRPQERAEVLCVFEPTQRRASLRRPGQTRDEIHYLPPAAP